jgi:phosphoglycolate phosphatase-like HAD superfamily hydrolase
MTKPLVLLFDIDGTLLHAHGAGRRAISHAFDQLFGAPHAIDELELQGMTDPLILKAGLSAIGQPPRHDLVEKLLELYLLQLQVELLADASVTVLDGVVEMLNWLPTSGIPVALGLGTGNVEAGAKAKLDRVSLTSHFSFGGYGSDHELRSELLQIAELRGERLLGLPRESFRTIVIGDTLRDIDAARAIGAESLAVGTGGVSLDALLDHGATFAVKTLSDPQAYRYLGEEHNAPCSSR